MSSVGKSLKYKHYRWCFRWRTPSAVERRHWTAYTLPTNETRRARIETHPSKDPQQNIGTRFAEAEACIHGRSGGPCEAVLGWKLGATETHSTTRDGEQVLGISIKAFANYPHRQHKQSNSGQRKQRHGSAGHLSSGANALFCAIPAAQFTAWWE